MSMVAYSLLLVVLSILGAWFMGRLTVRVNSIRSVALKILLYIAVGLASMIIVIAPFLLFAFESLNHSQDPRGLSSHLAVPPLLLWVGSPIYYGVIYLSFRAGTGRVHGHG